MIPFGINHCEIGAWRINHHTLLLSVTDSKNTENYIKMLCLSLPFPKTILPDLSKALWCSSPGFSELQEQELQIIGLAGHLNANLAQLHTQNLSTTLLIFLYWDEFDTTGLYMWWCMLLFWNSKITRKKKYISEINIQDKAHSLYMGQCYISNRWNVCWKPIVNGKINSPITSAMFSFQSYAAKWLGTYYLFYASHLKESMSDLI